MLKKASTPLTISGPEKAAIALLSLGPEITAQVMKNLSPQENKRLSRALTTVSQLDRQTQFTIAQEFRKIFASGDKLLVDGEMFAKEVIRAAFGNDDTEKYLGTNSECGKNTITALFAEVPEKVLREFIVAEHPQTIAFLMAEMKPEQAAKVLQGLPEELSSDLVARVANLTHVKAEIVQEAAEALRTQFSTASHNTESIDGTKTAAEILNVMARSHGERILVDLEETDPSLATTLRDAMFTFEDLVKLNDKGVQVLLKDLPRDQLILSLKTASVEIRELVFKNLSKRAVELIKEELDTMGAVKLKSVQEAQRRMVDTVLRLQGEGKIEIEAATEEMV